MYTFLKYDAFIKLWAPVTNILFIPKLNVKKMILLDNLSKKFLKQVRF